MNGMLVLDIIVWSIFLIMVGYWAFARLAARISPKYAAKRKVKAKLRTERALQKSQQRENKRRARMVTWAKDHPEDLIAKRFLTTEITVPPQGLDPQAALRQRQQAADDLEQRIAAHKEAEERQLQELLAWALEHPESPEAHRHLREQLEAATNRLEHADQDISHCKAMLRYQTEDDPEAILYGTRLSEAQVKKSAEQELVRRIQMALTVSPSTADGL